ncbi:MAG TPA: phosphoribosylformylglycinamidine synthase subunit PurQ, partial [Nitrospiria bacterium]|nr:phosphoribosylformylglycinamidine synthase subunit PurQ [Nitrospiria bacterium]
NGSTGAIAGICNKEGNVLGMMPHPERCFEGLDGNSDGRLIFESILSGFKGAVK